MAGRRHLPAGAAAVAAAVALVPLMAAVVSAGPEPVLDGSTADNAQRKAAWAPDGALYVTLVQPVGGVPHVFMKVSRDDGSTWTAAPQLSSAEAFRPCVAVDSAGRVHVAWSEYVGSVRQVFTARWEGGPGWLDREQVSFTPGYSGFPALGVDAADRVHLAWYGFDGETYRVHYRWHAAGQPWGPTAVVSGGVADANSPALAIGPDSSVHVAFFASIRGVAEVWYLHGGPGGWDPPELVSPAAAQSQRPTLAVFGSGDPAVAYVATGSGVPRVVAATRDPVTGWPAPTLVSSAGEGGDNPSLSVGAAGQGRVFFETADGALRVSELTDGVWQEPRAVPTGSPAHWPSTTWTMFPRALAARAAFTVWTQADPPEGTWRLGWAFSSALPQGVTPPPGPAHPDMPAAPAAVALLITGAVLGAALASGRRETPPRR